MGDLSAGSKSPLFHLSVDKLLDNWTALQIAVKSGQGRGFGAEIAKWMRGAVEDFFYTNDDLEGDEVAEFLGTIMNRELDTIVEDNSLEEIGLQLCTHFRLAKDSHRKEAELQLLELHKVLDAATLLTKPEPHAVPDSSDDEGDGDEEMDTEENTSSTTNGNSGPSQSQSQSPQAQDPQPHLHRVGNNMVTDPDEEGWSTVVKSKKH